MSDKITALAEKLAQNASVFVPRLAAEGFESILRAELKPLLEAAEFANKLMASLTGKESEILAAEHQNWTARNPDGR